MRKTYKLFFLIFIFFIFTTYSTKEKSNKFAFFFPIKKILIENNLGTDLNKLKPDLDFLIEVWDGLKNYITKKDRLQAAEQLITIFDENADLNALQENINKLNYNK